MKNTAKKILKIFLFIYVVKVAISFIILGPIVILPHNVFFNSFMPCVEGVLGANNIKGYVITKERYDAGVYNKVDIIQLILF